MAGLLPGGLPSKPTVRPVPRTFAGGREGDTALVTDRQGEDLMDRAEDVAGDVARHDWFKRLARFGMVARGVLYVVVALLALRIATGNFDERADKQGAMQAVVRQPFGKVLVAILAVGFAGYALWRFVEAVIGPQDEKDPRKAMFKRLGYAARGLLYTGFCATAAKLLVGADEGAGAGERGHRLDGAGAGLAGRAAAGGRGRPRRRRRPGSTSAGGGCGRSSPSGSRATRWSRASDGGSSGWVRSATSPA